MIDRPTKERSDAVRLRYEFDAPLLKVWRAIRMPELRDAWLPGGDLADPEPVSETIGQEVRYRMRESAPPHLESEVTLQIAANGAGGTVLQVIHELADAPCERVIAPPANSNGPPRMLAA